MNVDYSVDECAWGMHVSVSSDSVCVYVRVHGCGSQTKLGRKHSGSKGVNLYTLDLIYCLFDLQAEYFMKFNSSQWEKNHLQVAQ